MASAIAQPAASAKLVIVFFVMTVQLLLEDGHEIKQATFARGSCENCRTTNKARDLASPAINLRVDLSDFLRSPSDYQRVICGQAISRFNLVKLQSGKCNCCVGSWSNASEDGRGTIIGQISSRSTGGAQ